jgi:hypothetical protein
MIELAIALGIVALGAAAAIVTIYWTKILKWARDSLFPWVDKNLPRLADDVRDAFVVLDKVIAPIRLKAKEAWERLRQTLLRQVAEFEQMTDKTWLLRITSWVRVKLTELDTTPVVKELRTETVIPYEELPPEVREQLLRQGLGNYKVDVTHAKDVEMAMTN